MNTSELFKNEIGYIHNPVLQDIVKETLDEAPEYIQKIPASSTGKYHPVYTLGEGGLIRHIKAAVGIAHCLIETEIFRNLLDVHDYETLMKCEDVAYSALILHDCMKCGEKGDKTVHEHPLLAAELFKKVTIEYLNKLDKDKQKELPYKTLIYSCIRSHMGQWNTSKYSKVVLPKPKNPIEHFVHLCDYLASRKFLIYDFDKE